MKKGRMERTETGRQGGERENKSWKKLFQHISVAFYLAPIPLFLIFGFFLCLKNNKALIGTREKKLRVLTQNRCNRLLLAPWTNASCAEAVHGHLSF